MMVFERIRQFISSLFNVQDLRKLGEIVGVQLNAPTKENHRLPKPYVNTFNPSSRTPEIWDYERIKRMVTWLERRYVYFSEDGNSLLTDPYTLEAKQGLIFIRRLSELINDEIPDLAAANRLIHDIYAFHGVYHGWLELGGAAIQWRNLVERNADFQK
jgi:hypothetical protein